MLSRIAESMFWIGRYVERADDTARILDVQTQLMLEDPAVDAGEACRQLLGIMGVDAPEDGVIDLDTVLAELAFDTSAAASISSAIAAARESARRARETLSVSMWEALNTTYRAVQSGEFRALRPPGTFSWVRARAAMITGIADSTMTRDESYQFMILGRAIERADMTARMVSTAALSGGYPAWATTLRACGGYDAFLRANSGVQNERAAVDFLLLDRLFPRSVVYALQRAEISLGYIDGGEYAGRRSGFQNEAERLLGRTRTRFEYGTLADVMADLPAAMTSLQETCAVATEVISRHYFNTSATTAWQGVKG